MAMSTQQEERDHFTVSGFCEAILSTAEFECSLEDILHKKASEAKRLIWKMELSMYYQYHIQILLDKQVNYSINIVRFILSLYFALHSVLSFASCNNSFDSFLFKFKF